MRYIRSIGKDALLCPMIQGEYSWEGLHQEKKRGMKEKSTRSKAVHAGIALLKQQNRQIKQIHFQNIFRQKNSWLSNSA